MGIGLRIFFATFMAIMGIFTILVIISCTKTSSKISRLEEEKYFYPKE